jgi:hypothetical protein
VSAPDAYEVRMVAWDGHKHGPDHLAAELNRFAADGWTVVSVLPTSAGASARSLIAASASAETSEVAVVLRRSS